MTCTKCQTPDHLFLLEGGLCQKCHLEKTKIIQNKPRRKGRPVGSYTSKAQRKETKQLQAQCKNHMQRLGLPAYKFARHVGITPSAFYRWIKCEFSYHRQPRFNEKVIHALKSI